MNYNFLYVNYEKIIEYLVAQDQSGLSINTLTQTVKTTQKSKVRGSAGIGTLIQGEGSSSSSNNVMLTKEYNIFWKNVFLFIDKFTFELDKKNGI